MSKLAEDEKSARLHKLLCEIEKCVKCYKNYEEYSEEDGVRIRRWCNVGPWFYPPYKGRKKVKGFFGTGEVMFVCLRPSTRGGEIPDSKLERFYELLEEEGFENAHITDLVKCRGPAKDIPDYYFQNCISHLREEIDVLKPKMIVAVGREAQEKIKNMREKGFLSSKITVR